MAESGSDKHFGLAVTISVEALKALLLVNGGAATALVALTDKATSKVDYRLPVLLFGSAALLNALVMVLGYFSQLAYANHLLCIESGDGKAEANIIKHGRYQWIAIAVLVASLIVSGAAMLTAFSAIR